MTEHVPPTASNHQSNVWQDAYKVAQQKSGKFAQKVEQFGAGSFLRVALPLAVLILPVIQQGVGFQGAQSLLFILVFVGVVFANFTLSLGQEQLTSDRLHHEIGVKDREIANLARKLSDLERKLRSYNRRPKNRQRQNRELIRQRSALANANDRFAGAIRQVAVRLNNSIHVLSDDQAHLLCTTLLLCVREAAEAIIGNDRANDARMRATLAVPIEHNTDGMVSALRIWCYDFTYENRGWTRLPIDWPGAPRLFKGICDGTSRQPFIIVNDINAELEEAGVEIHQRNRIQKSIFCMVVPSVADPSQPLGVVNIDATPAAFFDVTSMQGIYDQINPMLRMLSFVLWSRKPGATYEFHQ